jgi:hypothetical protein
LGKLDALTGPANKNLTLNVVGYGVQDTQPQFQAALLRYAANPKRVTEKSAHNGGIYIQLSNNAGKVNTGGECFGDSGGPIFLARSNIIVGIFY